MNIKNKLDMEMRKYSLARIRHSLDTKHKMLYLLYKLGAINKDVYATAYKSASL